MESTGVSVVIPAFNRQDTIESAILSCIWQTVPPIEIIVVDDGSTDATRDVVSSIADERIRLIRQEKLGANAARNRGFRAAIGGIICFQDSDDIWIADKVERQLSGLRANSSCVASFGTIIEHDQFPKIFPKNKKIPEYLSPGEAFQYGALTTNILSTQTLTIYKRALEELGGFDEKLPRFQDWELAIRLFQAHTTHFSVTPLAYCPKTSGSITRNFQSGVLARKYILNKHRNLYRDHPLSFLRAKFAYSARSLHHNLNGIIK